MNTYRVELEAQEDQKISQGYAIYRTLPTHERIIRTITILSILWSVMLVTVFIPMLHFVLVPGFFILGLVMAVMTWQEKSLHENSEIPCPSCSKVFNLPKGPESWPKAFRCPYCYLTLKILKNKN